MRTVLCLGHCEECGRHFADKRSRDAHLTFWREDCTSPASDASRFVPLDGGRCYRTVPPSTDATVWAAKPERRTAILPGPNGYPELRRVERGAAA